MGKQDNVLRLLQDQSKIINKRKRFGSN